MANRWGIPKSVEAFVINRDENCIYCGVSFLETTNNFKHRPSWEHIINDIRINGIDNIARCCRSCNASKGSKHLCDWIDSEYCNNKGITKYSIAEVAKAHLKH